MTLENVIQKCAQATKLLDEKRVAEAIELLEYIAHEEGNFKIVDDIQRQKQTYQYMIHYLLEGMEDSARPTMYADIIASLRHDADLLLINKQEKDSPDTYFATLRMTRMSPLDPISFFDDVKSLQDEITLRGEENPDSLDARRQLYGQLYKLFDNLYAVAGCRRLLRETVNYIAAHPNDVQIPALAISAITLALLKYYDRDRLLALIDIYLQAQNEEVAARALTALLIVLRHNDTRAAADPDVMQRLTLLGDSDKIYAQLREVLANILRTRDTDRVTSKMRDEVIPELMKMKPDMLQKMQDSAMDLENAMLENNPEWADMLEESGLAAKIRDLNEMQDEGADLLMVSFSNLKNFPFFYSLPAWFLKFTTTNPEISLDPETSAVVDTLLQFDVTICDSDKYSLAIAMQKMPESQRKMMNSQFSMQFQQMRESMGDRLKSSDSNFSRYSTFFIRDLYRFFKLFRKHKDFEDPFAKTFNFLDLPVIGEILSTPEVMDLVGEFYFQRGYYADALRIFKLMESASANNAVYWEKLGFTLQSLGQDNDALTAYQRATLLKEPSEWLIRKLAILNRRMGNLLDAAEYYQQLLERNSDEIPLLLNLGAVYYELGDLNEAQKQYYHANYLDPENLKVLRALGWTELLLGRIEKSERILSRIANDTNAKPGDIMNAGHAQLLLGNLKEASSLYAKARALDAPLFDRSYAADRPTLIELGADSLSLDLIRDHLAHP